MHFKRCAVGIASIQFESGATTKRLKFQTLVLELFFVQSAFEIMKVLPPAYMPDIIFYSRQSFVYQPKT